LETTTEFVTATFALGGDAGCLEQLDDRSPLKLMAAMTVMCDKPMHENEAISKPYQIVIKMEEAAENLYCRRLKCGHPT
jgi:hypothetical protein